MFGRGNERVHKQAYRDRGAGTCSGVMHPRLCDSRIDLGIPQKNRVSDGPTPIHSALSGGASHIVTACHVPRPIQCRAIMQSKHWALTQRPFCGNPKSSPDAGSFNCTVCGIVPRHKAGAIFPILSRLRHTTPIKARISLTCGVLSAFLVLFRMLSR